MNKGLILMSGAGAGAGLMYLFDPDRGKRRRAFLRGKAIHVSKKAGDAAGKTQRDIRNHLHGAFAEIESLWVDSGLISNDVLEARVRSKLGRVVSHPGAIEVKAVDGLIMLSGQILANEVHPLLKCVASVHGVKNIDNYLEIHEKADDIPALQGGRRRGQRLGPFKANWSPTMRLIAGAAGSALAVYGARRRNIVGTLVSSVGVGLVGRALTNYEGARLLGFSSERKTAETSKPIKVQAPEKPLMNYSSAEDFADSMPDIQDWDSAEYLEQESQGRNDS